MRALNRGLIACLSVLRLTPFRFGKKLVVFLSLIAILTPAAATASLISQGYTAETQLPSGTIVSLKAGSGTQVESATVANAASILGIVISEGSSQVEVSSTEGTQVLVATGGVEQVLVSDINGDIQAGDQITASPIAGVGMKATNSSKVVGVAQEKFPNTTASTQEYTDKAKKKHKAKLGSMPIMVNVAYYYKQPDKTLIPQAVQNIANALAGKTVSALPILVSVGIFIVTLIVVVSIIYSMINSSIISVGRNPMSQSAVYRNVIQLSLLIVIILAVSVVAIYLVLRTL